MPHLKEIVEELKNDPVVFISITDEDESLIKKFLTKRPMPGWVGIDSDKSCLDSYRVTSRPKTVVIDPAGKIAQVTQPHLLTVANIRAIGSGKFTPPTVAESKRVVANALPVLGSFSPGVDPYMMPWIRVGRANNQMGYQSILRPSCLKTPAGHGISVPGEGAVGISAIGQTAKELIHLSYQTTSTHRVVDESNVLTDGLFDLTFSRTSGYSVDRGWSDIQGMIAEYFDFQISEVEKEKDVLAVTLNKSELHAEADQDWKNDPSTKTLKKVQMFLTILETQTGELITAEYGDPNEWYIDTFQDKWYELKGADLQAWLESKGVVFRREKRKVSMVIVKPLKKAK